MILKASQRSGGQELANHLMNVVENEHVRIHEMRGFSSDTLKGAFKEAEGTARGTKCQKYLFSLSLSPPEQERVRPDVFERAIDEIEKRLGLEGQPRAIIFHEKHGRRHTHCVWSRIDAETMTARHLPYFKTRLQEISRELYLENGWKMPRGFANAAERNPTNFTLAEWQQAKRQNVDPRWLKQTLQDCWTKSDSEKAFSRSLEERGFFLAKGDKRSFVILDHRGEVWSLARALGLKTKDIRERLGDGACLKSVDQTKELIAERMTPAIRRHIQDSKLQFEKRSATLGHYKMQMTHLHREARSKLEERQARDWDAQNKDRNARLPKGVRGLWHRITGRYQEVRAQNEAQAKATRAAQADERQKLIENQLGQRAVLQEQFKYLRSRQAAQLVELRSDIGRFLKFTRGTNAERKPARDVGLGLKLER